jgi:hypothetical protein
MHLCGAKFWEQIMCANMFNLSFKNSQKNTLEHLQPILCFFTPYIPI